MSKFDELSKNNKFEELRQKLQSKREAAENKKNANAPEESWKFLPQLPKDKSTIKFTVRILPNRHDPESATPWIEAFAHMFRRSDGKFVYTLCPTTFDMKAPCPICEKSKKLFATKDKADEEVAKKLWKKLRYYANVYVKNDPRAAEENQAGKVAVFEFGKKLFDKFSDAVIEQQIDIKDPIDGHDLMLIIKHQGEHANYDSSLFVTKPSPVHESEEELNKIYDSIINLKEKVLGRGALSYEKLQELLTGKPLANTTPSASVTSDSAKDGKRAVEKVSEGVIPTDDEPKASVKVEKKEEKVAKANKVDDDDFDFDFDDEKK